MSYTVTKLNLQGNLPELPLLKIHNSQIFLLMFTPSDNYQQLIFCFIHVYLEGGS